MTVTERITLKRAGFTLDPRVRCRLCRQTYLSTRQFGRGRAFSALMAVSMLLFGRTPRHRIY